ADGAVRRTAGADEGAMRGDVLVLPALPGGSDDRTGSGGGRRALLETVGRLWSRGVPLDRTALDAGHRRVPLPTYPFRRDRYWADPPVSPLLHRVRWENSALPEASAAAVRSVLLTGPDATAVELLGRQLAAEGLELHTGGEEPPDSVVLVVGAAPGQEEGADAVGRAQETALAAFDVALGRLDATRGAPDG
ncbi:hypothetical protein DDE05_47295, partial [Streptomyces cavourensis]